MMLIPNAARQYHIVPSSCVEPPALPRYEAVQKQSLSIPQISLGEHRANRLRDYGVTRFSAQELAGIDRWTYEGLLDKARVEWHRDTAAKLQTDLQDQRRWNEIEEIASSNRWGARL